MTGTAAPSKFKTAVGCAMLLAGVLVFAIRMHHEGPYALPEEGNLRAGLLALALGGAWLRPWPVAPGAARTVATTVVGIASVIVLFFALYATLAELEEVIVLRADQGETPGKDLRLWVVDYDGSAWVTMPATKAEENRLVVQGEGQRAELLRSGERSCVIPRRFDDRPTVDRTHQLRHEKYAIQRLATAVGLFGRSAGANTVTLQLEPCPTNES